MMFAVRGIAVSFSIFFILYSVLSVAVCLGWAEAMALRPAAAGETVR